MKKRVSILGSTGSVGTQTLRVVDAFPDRFEVVGLAAGGNAELLAEQVARYRPAVVSLASAEALERLGQLVDLSSIRSGAGTAAACEVATHTDTSIVVASAVGAVGLEPTWRALEAGKDVALANKETLVMAGELMLAASRATGARLLPVDSEHCALHQCLDGRRIEDVKRLLLTASGGPFRRRPQGTFDTITPAEALAHPTWSMGRKISIDSATMMNKGLEVIEARWLFGLPGGQVDVLIHPQSIIHSMVEFVDGNVIAQLGVTDMRLPIQYALTWPDRWPTAVPGLDLTRPLSLEFEPPDRERFPCLGLAYRALDVGGSLPAVLNAANEESVHAFLDGRVPFTAIPETIEQVMDDHRPGSIASLEDVLEADRWARERAQVALGHRQHAWEAR